MAHNGLCDALGAPAVVVDTAKAMQRTYWASAGGDDGGTYGRVVLTNLAEATVDAPLLDLVKEWNDLVDFLEAKGLLHVDHTRVRLQACS